MADFVFSAKNPEAPLAYFETRAMHSRLELLLIIPDESEARRICFKAEETVLGLEKCFDRHNSTGSVAALNSQLEAEGLDEDLFFALELCEKFRSLTFGYFDIAAVGRNRERPAYSLDPVRRKAALKKGVMLDFGGFAKGYALEVIRKNLEKEGVSNALLNFGNSSVVGMGKHPFGDCWKVRAEEGGRTFRLGDSAISVSGLSPSGNRHIIDPVTGAMAEGGGNISVEGRSALVCEVLSTALFAAPKSLEAGILESFEGYTVNYGS